MLAFKIWPIIQLNVDKDPIVGLLSDSAIAIGVARNNGRGETLWQFAINCRRLLIDFFRLPQQLLNAMNWNLFRDFKSMMNSDAKYGNRNPS